MKKLTLISVLCASGIFGGTSALAADSGFTVDVGLTTKCVATTTGTPSLAFAYESFQTGLASPLAPISLAFKCTRGIAAPTLSFDTTSGGSSTGEGVAGGLRYTLSVGADTGVAGTAASNGSGGSEKTLVYSVTGSIASGQAGDASLTTRQIRSLIASY